MKTALRQLLDDLDRIIDEHEEVGDTEVRETMSEAIHQRLLSRDATYELPQQFGMFSDEGDELVQQALARFLAHPETLKLASGATTPQERLDPVRARIVLRRVLRSHRRDLNGRHNRVQC